MKILAAKTGQFSFFFFLQFDKIAMRESNLVVDSSTVLLSFILCCQGKFATTVRKAKKHSKAPTFFSFQLLLSEENE